MANFEKLYELRDACVWRDVHTNLKMPKCYVCGGTEFVKEEGFLYCSECQTRCKGVSEQVFDSWATGAKYESKTKINKEPTTTNEDNWTTWEAYNYVLKGMVDELIKLGASPNLKPVVFQLWAKYLRKIDVAFLKKNKKLPKLGASYCERDARVLYSWPVKSQLRKRKSKSNASLISSGASSHSNARLRAKAKRALARAEHDKDSTLCSDMDSSNFSDQIPASSAPTITSPSKSILLRKNKYMTEEAVNFNRRVRQRESTLDKEPWKKKIRIQPTNTSFVCKVKLLAIIHLSLILCEDDIQLSDLLRWIREGHLSYCSVTHFLPAEMTSRGKCVRGLEFKPIWPSYITVCRVAGNLVAELGIKSLPTPSLPNLIQRYAKELELPGELADFAVQLWADNVPEMPLNSETYEGNQSYMHKKSCPFIKDIPNYEGRAMAFLLFTMKLLFALDGYTEQILSKFAQKANKILGLCKGKNFSHPKESTHDVQKLFVWKDWVNYIEFRDSLISRWHYPMYVAREPGLFQLDHIKENVIPASPPFQNAVKYLDFCLYAVESKSMDKDGNKDPKWVEFMRKHLHDLNEIDTTPTLTLQNFQPSKTPCHSYMDELCKKTFNNWQKVSETMESGPCDKLLQAQFCFTSIDFILKPSLVMEALKEKNVFVDLIKSTAMGGKDSGYVKFHDPISSISVGKNKTNDLLPVNLTYDAVKRKKKLNWLAVNDRNQLLNQIQTIESGFLKVKSKDMKCKSRKIKKGIKVKRHIKGVEGGQSSCQTNDQKDVQRLELMLPYRQVWMLYGAFHELTEEKFNDLCSKMPSSFSWLLHLCANLLEMSERSLYDELVNVELVHKCMKHKNELYAQKKRHECIRTKIALAAW
ncbi:TATA box-binding protein-associated factor RNA polymerase I subunit B [Hetaerina americana]|uniref:TATA box-binding protein-associated factor RNA polymerase I subunit B n=1 Tax=Hetaerina americana TaxID=62018 RepID=UPI003A7F37DC